MSSGLVKERKSAYNKKKSKVEDAAIEAAVLKQRVSGINDALLEVPERYRKRILDNIIFKETGTGYSDKTWKVWKQKFLYGVARNLSMM